MPRDTHSLVTIRFSAYGADGRAHPAPGASSFEEAAMMYAEHHHPSDDGHLTVYVVDEATGCEQTFTL